MKTTALRIWLILVILSLATLSCGLFSRDRDDDPEAENVAPQAETDEDITAGDDEDVAPSDDEDLSETLLGDGYRSLEGGYAFDVVPGYELDEIFGIVTMSPPGVDPEVGPVLVMIGGIDDEEVSNDQMLGEFTSGLGEDGKVFEQREVSVGGLPGIAVGFKGTIEGQDAIGRAAFVAVDLTQMFSLLAVAAPDFWDDELESTFDAVLGSVTFFEPEDDGGETSIDFGDSEPDADLEPVEKPETPAQEVIRQWASTATAGTEYSDTDWSAAQATGAPDSPDCGDQETAWAAMEGDSVDWLEVYYDTPVIPTEVNIYESHTPSQVSSVDLIDSSGAYHEVYSAIPEMKIDCPYVLSVPVSDADYQAVAVRVIIDQSVIELPWAEIDAVELVGLGSGDGESVEVETPPEAPPEAAPVGEISMPDGTLWRVNEDSLGIELGTFGDIAVADDGRIYVPDNGNGIFIFDADGNLLDLIDHDDLQNPVDVKVGPDGNIYVADYFADAILIFTPDGDFISKFGESGNGPGQFGSFGPKAFAVCSDHTIYALDDNKDDNGDPFVRLITFDKDGTYLGETLIDEGFPVGMDCGPDGYLYMVNYFGHNIQKRGRDGELIREIGSDALAGTSPQYLTFDQNGWIYLTVWEEPGVVVLDPSGNFMGRFGYDEDYTVTPWPDGAMNQPKGIGVSADGSLIFFTDYANSQPFLEALEIR